MIPGGRTDPDTRAFGPEEVKAIRAMFGVSQPIFGQFLGVGVKTVRSWGAGPPDALGDGLLVPRGDPDLA